ncbi:GNAT family N-acetyltransferase, partial [Acinetobacter baumannii]|nr:GNAT family N-acetyltransferase [Acinetobacter baumannii]
RVIDLSVAASARRRGVARAVLLALQEEVDAIALRVRADNAAARRLYAGLGFVPRRDNGATLELDWSRARPHPE